MKTALREEQVAVVVLIIMMTFVYSHRGARGAIIRNVLKFHVEVRAK